MNCKNCSCSLGTTALSGSELRFQAVKSEYLLMAPTAAPRPLKVSPSSSLPPAHQGDPDIWFTGSHLISKVLPALLKSDESFVHLSNLKMQLFKKTTVLPWLAGLSGLNASLKNRVTGSIPSQGTCLGCRPGPQWGALKRQPHIDVSLPLSFSLPSPLK